MADPDWPELTLPQAEAEFLRRHYEKAEVILEYGSGGSTVLASRMPGKLIFSVESDRSWAVSLQASIDATDLPSPAILYHVDIGPTGAWGRPFDDSHWQSFYRYPMAIWIEPFFRHPDLILIDGRLRPACFVAACLQITKPVTILFDDYLDRKSYHVVEKLLMPAEIVGRMARFEVSPRVWPAWTQALLLELCTRMAYVDDPVTGSRPSYWRTDNDTLKRAGVT